MNGGDDTKVAELRRYLELVADQLQKPVAVEDLVRRADAVDAVYIPGGHGPMEDLPASAALGQLVSDLHASGRVVAAMCHGPAGLLAARRPDGGWLFEGRRVTAFTDAEEQQVGLADQAWLLEDRLRQQGAIFESGPAWQPHVVTDGRLITGQNPASSQATADQTLAAIEVRQR